MAAHSGSVSKFGSIAQPCASSSLSTRGQSIALTRSVAKLSLTLPPPVLCPLKKCDIKRKAADSGLDAADANRRYIAIRPMLQRNREIRADIPRLWATRALLAGMGPDAGECRICGKLRGSQAVSLPGESEHR